MSRPLPLLFAALALCVVPACGGGDEEAADADLTSATALERKLTFEGYVFVETGASSAAILAAVRAQTRSAFGALSTQNVSVSSRELADVDTKTFIKQPVTVVDPETGETSKALRVRYLYRDTAILPKSMAKHSSLSLGLLHGDYQAQSKRVLAECTGGSAEDREMESDIWYVFNPSLSRCQKAMAAEQHAIDEARAGLAAPDAEVVPAELERLYIPMTARLEPAKTAAGKIYPEYDRLLSGGIEPGTLTISLLNGIIGHEEPGKPVPPLNEDEGYWEMLGQMDVILQAHPNLKVVGTEPATDLSTFTIDGKKITGVSFADYIDWELYETSYPSGLTAAQKKKLRKAAAERMKERWVTFEEVVSVQIGQKAPKDLTVRIRQYFGADEDETPYRRAIKESDVFLFNGHSFIGEGPLDPANFHDADFPESYQLLFIDSCISYNYYDKDYFAFKKRGSKDLDLIVNGLESYSDGSGPAEGRFVVALLSGKQPHYRKLLDVASSDGTAYAWGKDALRVVDGELDNTYSPDEKPIKVSTK